LATPDACGTVRDGLSQAARSSRFLLIQGGQQNALAAAVRPGIQPARYVRGSTAADDTVTEGVNSWREQDFSRYADLMISRKREISLECVFKSPSDTKPGDVSPKRTALEHASDLC
jgi:hypothetical protein